MIVVSWCKSSTVLFLNRALELRLWTSQVLRLQGPHVQSEGMAGCLQEPHQGEDRHSQGRETQGCANGSR